MKKTKKLKALQLTTTTVGQLQSAAGGRYNGGNDPTRQVTCSCHGDLCGDYTDYCEKAPP